MFSAHTYVEGVSEELAEFLQFGGKCILIISGCIIKDGTICWAWWHIPVIPALERRGRRILCV